MKNLLYVRKCLNRLDSSKTFLETAVSRLQVKQFAQQLISRLDDGDQVAVVTFGDTAEVFFKLETLNSSSRVGLPWYLCSQNSTGFSVLY